ncbi:MAG: hypothetical protein JWP36_2773 [Paucimonas sp.]|nr:hypothetical protein [Paucimonas sp.]
MDEHLGPYTLHLVAYELPDGTWDPFLSIDRFDESVGDFRRVLDKHRVAEKGVATYEEAMEAARRAGNGLVQQWQRGQAAPPL